MGGNWCLIGALGSFPESPDGNTRMIPLRLDNKNIGDFEIYKILAGMD